MREELGKAWARTKQSLSQPERTSLSHVVYIVALISMSHFIYPLTVLVGRTK